MFSTSYTTFNLLFQPLSTELHIMNTPKLLIALRTLTKEEWPSVKKYILTETSENSDAFALFIAIWNKRDKIESIRDGEEIRKKKFPLLTQKGYLNLYSKLYGWLEDWFAINEMLVESFDRDLYLVKSHNRRGLYKNADQIALKLELTLEKQKLNTEYAKSLKQLYHYQYFSNNPIKGKKGTLILEKLATQHTDQYKNQTLLYLTELMNFGRMQNYDYEYIRQTLKQSISNLPHTALTPILNELLHQIEDEGSYNAENLYQYLTKSEITKPSEFHTLLTLYTIHIATKQRQKGDHTDLDLLKNLYYYGFENDIFIQNNKIISLQFTNLISVISKVSTYKDTTLLIDKWIGKVETKHPEEIKDLAYAIACLSHHKYKELIYYARHSSFDRVDQKIKAQGYYLIAQYSLNDGDMSLFRSLSTNFLRSLQRNKKEFSKRTYLAHYNFYDYITKLVKQKQKGKDIKIQKYDLIMPRSWYDHENEQLKKQGYTITLL